MSKDKLLEALRASRADYEAELIWVRFLLDAYAGTGGFSGQIKPPAISQLGWVAGAYGLGSSTTDMQVGNESAFKFQTSYLDQYPREDLDKYNKRVEIAHYQNFVETIFDLLLSYALKTPSTVEDLPPQVLKWKNSVTTSGISFWDFMRHVLARRTGLMGWTPVIIDQMPRPTGRSVAQVEADGIRVDPFLTALTPANVLDWYIDRDGVMQWVKLRLDYEQHPDPLKPPVKVEVYKIYTRTEIHSWEFVEGKKISEAKTTHPFKRVPLVSFQQKPNIEEPVRGVSMVGDACIASRRLFNLDSELDEHIRSNVFALLVVPVPEGKEAPKEVIGGGGNAVPVRDNATQTYEFVAPPASVAATLETRIENTVTEIFRRARVRSGRGGAGQQSGIAKQWDFEETNRLLADFVSQLSRAELEVYKIIAESFGVSEDAIKQIRVIPPTDFSVEDLAAEVERTVEALTLEMGATTDMLMKRRLSKKLVPNMSTEDEDRVNAELEAERAASLNESAEQAEIDAAVAAQKEIDDAAAALAAQQNQPPEPPEVT